MRFFRKSLVGLLLLSLTVGLFAYAGQMVSSAMKDSMSRKPRTSQQRERVFTVNVVTAEPQSITPMLEAFGEVQSRRTLDLRMATGGQVIELAEGFVEGGQVQAGEVLVRLNDADARSAVGRAEADVTDAMAEVEEADRALVLINDELQAARDQADLRSRALERQLDLKKRGVGTSAAVETAELAASSATQAVLSRRSAVDQAKARGAQAQTRLARAELALQDASRRWKDTVLTSEFSGTLGSISLVKGGLVSPNEKIGSLIDPETLEVAFRVSTEQYARLLDRSGKLIKSQAKVSLNVFGTELTTDAVLSRDSGSVGAGQTGRLLFAKLQNPRGLKPGDFVTVALSEPTMDNIIKLPSSALNADNAVLVLTEDDRLQSTEVRVFRQQGDHILVRGRGLSGREVVAEQTPVLGSGIKVKPLRSGEASTPKEPEVVELSDERRAKLIAAIEGNAYIPKDAKERILTQLKQDKVPAKVVERIESRMGG
ncbi:MAG: efflux transporter periplasmic adaptor subunit [Paracoccaceae bacterium]|nr:efflux transporter periplasmic adaptor subunit [Paracoccaceae bacterium]|tara:strand:+ start:1495 stop:2952 length:1458 start_codon:yes stop_codon:yes gene_type:complete